MSSLNSAQYHNGIVGAHQVTHQTIEIGEVKQPRTAERVIAKSDHSNLAHFNQFYNANQAILQQAAAGFSSLDNDTVDSAISSFTETVKIVTKGLDALSQVHPFIAVAVVAFKLVVNLDLTRRENNQKILAIRVRMQEMMCILFQLRGVTDPEDVGPGGITIKDRMQPLIDRIANTIIECGSMCDVYLKKNFLSRTIKSNIYESRLAEWAAKFADHTNELERALAVHTTLGIDAANKKLDNQEITLKGIETMMLKIFQRIQSPREREVLKFIEENGGASACIEKDDLLTKLIFKTGESISSVTRHPNAGGVSDVGSARKELLKELREDVDKVFNKNLTLFEGKMAIQHQQIIGAIGQQGQQTMSVLLSGTHEMIKDPDMQRLWKEMGWKGSVKARHFVLALRDYFLDQFNATTYPVTPYAMETSFPLTPPADPLASPTGDSNCLTIEGETQKSPIDLDDRWAFEHINISRLEPILEAIDDDSTGFIRVKEANAFAIRRPKGWTLLHWLAFWAKGWHHSIPKYKNQIYLLVQQMHRDLESVKADNRSIIDWYLNLDCFRTIEQLLRSTKTVNETQRLDAELASLTDTYVRSEEERLEKNLKSVGYHIDSPATVSLITGSRRIERHVYPLLYLLLKRHARIVKVACHHIIDFNELDYWAKGLNSLTVVVKRRVKTLGAIYKQVHVDTKIQFENFAFGMYRLIWENPDSWKRLENSLAAWQDRSTDKDESSEDGYNPDDVQLLHHPTQDTFSYTSIDTDLPPFQLDTDTPYYSFGIEGLWTGQYYYTNICGDRVPSNSPWLIHIVKVEEDRLSGRLESSRGLADLSGRVEGAEGGPRKVQLTLHGGLGSHTLYHLSGTFDPVAQIISGTCEIEGEWEGTEDEEAGEVDLGRGEGENADRQSLQCGKGLGEGVGDDKTEGTQIKTEIETEAEGQSQAPLGRSIFRLTRTPAEYYRCRYSMEEFQQNATKARWSFACKAALYHAQKKQWTWTFLKDRMAERRRVVDLRLRSKNERSKLTPNKGLNTEENDTLNKLGRFLSPTVSGLCAALVEYLFLRQPYLLACNGCRRSLISPGYLCLRCMTVDHSDWVDLCPDCLDKYPADGFGHDKTHSVLKTSVFIHDYSFAFLLPNTKSLVKRIKDAFRNVEGGRSASQSLGLKFKNKVNKLGCACCNQSISLPCCVCAICARDTFICIDCDSKQAVVPPNGAGPYHENSHITVRLYNTDEELFEKDATDVVFKRLEGLESALRNRAGALDERLTKLEDKLDLLLKKLIG